MHTKPKGYNVKDLKENEWREKNNNPEGLRVYFYELHSGNAAFWHQLALLTSSRLFPDFCMPTYPKKPLPCLEKVSQLLPPLLHIMLWLICPVMCASLLMKNKISHLHHSLHVLGGAML